jgi:hypothetical protein
MEGDERPQMTPINADWLGFLKNECSYWSSASSAASFIGVNPRLETHAERGDVVKASKVQFGR